MSDYIKRSEAAWLLSEAIDDSWETDYASDRLSEIPAADVEERKTCYDTEESRVFRCSECGYGVNDIFEDKNAPVYLFERFEYWHFCPCCGAQIKEVDT